MKKRYRILYTPSGAAGEYSDHGYAANLYRGCLHGCDYCYVPGVLRTPKRNFHDYMEPVYNMLFRLRLDLEEVGVLPEPIFLSFTCDSYPPDDELCGMTREAIKIIIASGNHVNILTKGGLRAAKDFDLLSSPGNKIGATLTFSHPQDSTKWEPFAAMPSMRIEMLKIAKSVGISTWASMEPVIDPDQTLELIRLAHPVVDEFKIGRLNHHPLAKTIDWPRFRADAITLCNNLGVKYVIKKDLREAR